MSEVDLPKLLILEKNNEQKEYLEDSENALRCFGPLGKINILVGPNNSRKSRFLRYIMRQHVQLFVPEDPFPCVDRVVQLAVDLGEFAKSSANRKLCEIVIAARLSRLTAYLSPETIAIPHDNVNIPLSINFDSDFFKKLSEIFSSYPMNSMGENSETGKTIEYMKQEEYLFFLLGVSILNDLMQLGLNSLQKAAQNLIEIRNCSLKPESNLPEKISELHKCLKKSMSLPIVFRNAVKMPHIYIPTTRLAITPWRKRDGQYEQMKEDFLATTTEKNYKFVDLTTVKIHTGLNLFQELRQARNGRKEIRNRIAQFEKFIGDNFFSGSDVDLIAYKPEGLNEQSITVSTENETDRPMHDLGDGIQSLLIMLFPVFMAELGTWVFIEEPESHLHPGLQVSFLKTLLENEYLDSKNLRFFLTTHSNHLLDKAIANSNSSRISVFSFKKMGPEDGGKTIVNSNKVDSDLLDLLGARNSSLLMSNCTIWVEGPSDRKIIQAFLNAYSKALGKKKYVQGIHYEFIEYGGSNIVHYIFSEEENEIEPRVGNLIQALSISNKIFLLADKDNPVHGSIKDKRIRDLEELSADSGRNFEFKTTGAREIENTIYSSIIKNFLSSKLKEEIVKNMNINVRNYGIPPMGKYLEGRYIAANEIDIHTDDYVPKFHSVGSEALKPGLKRELSQFVLDESIKGEIVTWNEIEKQENAKEITEKIWSFIERQNVIT